MRNTIAAVLFIAPTLVSAQDPQKYASIIDEKSLKENLSIIASDAMEGRLTGSRGQKMAAAFIADHFESLGLEAVNKGSYYQPFSLYSYEQKEIKIKTQTAEFKESTDVVFYGTENSEEKEYEVVFVGGGSDAELSQVRVNNRVAVLAASELSASKAAPIIAKLMTGGAARILIYSTVPEAEYVAFMAQMQGTLSVGKMSLTRPAAGEPQLFFVSKAVVESLFGKFDKLKKNLSKIKPVKASLTTRIKETVVKTENVMGLLEGTDKRNEVVVISAHYDHIGKAPFGDDLINNGADDDGSGTVTILQLATAFAKAKEEGHGPRRSILFMTVSAEEFGLYGSEYYTDVNPVIPLERTVVDLNIDMIGRWDEEHKGKAPYVYVIGADKLSSELQEINVRNNEKYTKLEFDYTYNDENHPSDLYKRSDHWNFAKHGVPIVFYFDGIHEDYHKPSDEIEKIDFEILVKRARCVFYTAWEVGNRERRLVVDK